METKPDFVIEAYLREDIARQMEKLPAGKPFKKGTKFLRRGVEPNVGQYIKMQVLCQPTWSEEFEEEVAGCFMGGRVHAVLGKNRVAAIMSVTSMPAPDALEVGDWDVELAFDDELEHPWTMVAMRPRMAN